MGSNPARTTINTYMIDFGVIYFVLIIERLGEEITDRVYYAVLDDCLHTAIQLNHSYTGNPPIRAYCLPETRKKVDN